MAIQDWSVANITTSSDEVGLRTISSAVELLCEIGRGNVGEMIEFYHLDSGLIVCVAGGGFSTLTFDSGYDRKNHSTSGFKWAHSRPPAVEEVLWADSTGYKSYMSQDSMLPILDVVRGLVFILETHEYPPFLSWGI